MARPITWVDTFPSTEPHMAMRRALTAAAAVMVAILTLGLGCGATDGGGGATNATCQAIRICAVDCTDEACVMTNCKSRGTTEAQATFQALYDCTKDPGRGTCTSPSDVNCLCLAQCLQDPPCVPEVEAC